MKKFLPLFLALIGAPLLLIMISNVSLHFGDQAVFSDTLFAARSWYNFAILTNPFNTDIAIRLLAVDTQITDRDTPDNEEAANVPPNDLTQAVAPSNVLGVTSCVPVLMYHYIRVNPWPTDTVGFGLSTPPAAFAQQLDYFKSKGYETVTLSDLKEYIALKKAMVKRQKDPNVKLPRVRLLPTKPLVITLDDGYEDTYTQAYPLLKERGMNAVNFVITGFVGLPNYLTWPEIQELDTSGVIDIESHTVHHYALGSTGISPDVIKYELTQSKKDLETHLGKVVDWLAYPYGSVNNAVSAETARVYFAAFGTNFGSYQSTEAQYTLPRIRVSGGDTGESVDTRIHQALADAKCVQ